MNSKIYIFTAILMIAFISMKAQIIHVPAGQPTVQEGINTANNGDTVLVADGTYLENINFLGKAITVASHYIIDGDTNHINNTILDGSQPANPDEASVVRFVTGEDTTSILCGFTITGGTGMLEPTYSARIGGGIVCYYASAKIIFNKIIDNQVTSSTDAWGAGINIYSANGWAVIENNTISGNISNASNGLAEGGGIELSCNARVCNNTITGNQCLSMFGDADGGGMYHISLYLPEDTLIMENNRISNNLIDVYDLARGGGVAVLFSYCVLINNTIVDNHLEGYTTVGGGLFIKNSVSSIISGNKFENNIVDPLDQFLSAGCACIFPDGPVYVEDNQFIDNQGPLTTSGSSGGGLQIRDAFTEQVSVKRNVFKNNAARFGGGFYSRNCYNMFVVNNFFSGNQSVDGGAIGMYIPSSVEEMRPVFINNTLQNNNADSRGGGTHLNCESNFPIFFNCIFYDNTAPTGSEVSLAGNVQPIIISYSCIDPDDVSGTWDGTGNINDDPKFILFDNLGHLSSTSPCINAGTPSLDVNGTVYFAPGDDIDGEPRPDPVSDTADIGSDEFYPGPPVALYPEDIGEDYFVALWNEAIWSQGYFLDVAYDADFVDVVPGYENVATGTDTSYMVSDLMTGTYYFRVRTYYGLWTSSNSNTIQVELPDDIDELNTQHLTLNTKLYPNPTRGIVDCRLSVVGCQFVTVSVYDVHGREVAVVFDGELPAGYHSCRYDMSGLPEGMYFVRVRSGRDVATTKLVLVR